MSMPYGGQQQPQLFQPPPFVVPNQQQQVYTNHGGSSSVGPVIAVLTVITVLGVISAIIGRLCSGRRVPGLGQYDFEGWFERKFAPCIDGGIGTTLPTRVPRVNGTGRDGGVAVPIVIPVEVPKQSATNEAAEEEES